MQTFKQQVPVMETVNPETGIQLMPNMVADPRLRRPDAVNIPGQQKRGKAHAPFPFLQNTANYLLSAAFTSNLPPVTVFPTNEAVGTALDRIALRICATDAPGCVDAYNATAPVTCGVAMEVPL